MRVCGTRSAYRLLGTISGILYMKLNKQLDNQIKSLGIYQVIGGGLGIILNAWILINTGYITGIIVFLFIVAFCLFGFSIYCGRLLIKSAYEKGLRLSKINQVLQVIVFSTFGYGFKYISGLMVLIAIDLTNSFLFTFEFSVSAWRITINSDNQLNIVGVNLVAFFLVWYVSKLQNNLDEYQELLKDE